MSESPAGPERHREYRTRVTRLGDDAIQAAIVEGVATLANRDPTDMEPLYDAVDPDALARLVQGSAGFRTASFVYAGHRVQLFAGGEVVVRPTA